MELKLDNHLVVHQSLHPHRYSPEDVLRSRMNLAGTFYAIHPDEVDRLTDEKRKSMEDQQRVDIARMVNTYYGNCFRHMYRLTSLLI